MTLFDKLLAIPAVGVFIACIFFVLFGEISVRKLRRNPQTKSELGLDYVSGWDILNVVGALSLPRSWNRKLRSTSAGVAMQANADLLYRYTTRFDRVLGRIYFFLLMTSGTGLIVLMLLNYCGAFR